MTVFNIILDMVLFRFYALFTNEHGNSMIQMNILHDFIGDGRAIRVSEYCFFKLFDCSTYPLLLSSLYLANVLFVFVVLFTDEQGVSVI